MEQFPTTESGVQKVVRIARELDISIEEAAVTCDAFHLAFSDKRMRRAIFDVIDELDRSAARKGEPMGLIINYTVELGLDGIRVGRYADEIPAGEVVELTPNDRARILLRIDENFPTQEFLGPLIVNRPGWHFDTFDPDNPDLEMAYSSLPLEPTRAVICLGPIRHTFNERFPFLTAAASKSPLPGVMSFLNSAGCTALDPHHLPPWSALPAGMPTFRSSGLSPPVNAENLGHSDRKMFLRHW